MTPSETNASEILDISLIIKRSHGFITRRDSLQRDLTEGMVEGKQGRERQGMQWSENITQWNGLTFVDAK